MPLPHSSYGLGPKKKKKKRYINPCPFCPLANKKEKVFLCFALT